MGTLPAGILGLFLKDKIELISNNIKIIGIALLITSCALFLIKDEKGQKDKTNITILDNFKSNYTEAPYIREEMLRNLKICAPSNIFMSRK